MAAPSMHICMDSDWLKGIVHEDAVGCLGSSSPSADQLITMPRQLQPAAAAAAAAADRRLRPQHDHPLKCPRCDSTHTKFCYYNNYSLSQPRYFCKTCRRYWTKGGSLRNVPVGGGCRKNKRAGASAAAASKKPSAVLPQPMHRHAETGLHLSFSGMQLPPTSADALCGLNLVDWKYDALFAGHAGSSPVEAADAMGIGDGGYSALNALRFPVGASGDRDRHLALPFGARTGSDAVELKPGTDRLLPLEWCGEAGRGPESCFSGMGLWPGMVGNAHGSSTAI